MQLTFKSTPLSFLASRLRQVQNQEQTLELRISDGMPEIGRILMTGGQPRLSSKQWRSDSVSITGGIAAWALYLPQEGDEPQLVEGWIPFQGKWNLPEHCREGILGAHITLRNLDCRVLSPRKLLLRASVALCAQAHCPEEAAVHTPEDLPDGLQLLRKSYPVWLCREAGEKVFSLEDTLMDPVGLPSKILCCRLMPRLTERSVAGDQLILRGVMDVCYIGIDENAKLHSGNLELPFAQLAQLDREYDKEATCHVDLRLAASDWQQESDGLRLRCDLLAQYRIHGASLLELAQDAYDPGMVTEPQLETLRLPVLLEERTESVDLNHNAAVTAKEVLDVVFYPDEPVTYRDGEKLVAELPGQYQILYIDENDILQSTTEPWCGRWELPAGEGCCLCLSVTVEPGLHASAQSGNILLNGKLKLEAGTWTEQEMPVLTGMQLGEVVEPDPERPSVVLRRAGNDTLWDIAKGLGSTVDAIRQANHLAGEPDPGQMLLIPVL